MRNKLWLELGQAKHNVEYASLYLDRQKNISNIFNILILLFSTSGIMGWAIWEKIPIIACSIISVLSLLKLIQPQLIMSEKHLAKLHKIHIFYCDFYNKLEKLWYDYEDAEINDKELKNILFSILDSEISISEQLDEIYLKKPKRLVKKAKNYTDDYLRRVFNINF